MRLAVLTVLVAPILFAQSTIDGAVVNSVTRAGIEGVSVKFYTQKGVRYEATTASDGSFHIADVQPGEYRHSIEKEGFEPPPRPEFPSPESTTSINGKDAVHITLEMTAWTTLRGRVVDAEGQPAASVPIQIRGPLPPREDAMIRTAADGSFAFNRLPPGDYTLLARPDPATMAPVDSVRTEMVATYYPSSLDSAQAQSIAIRGIGDESGFEIRLRRVPVYRVRGTVFDEADKPARGISVSISPAHPSPSDRFRHSAMGRTEYYLPGVPPDPPMYKTVTANDGTFEFPSIPVGEWTITANSEWRYEEATRRDIQQIGQAEAFVTKTDVEGVEIHIVSNFEFSASTIWPMDSPSKARWAMINLLPEGQRVEPSPSQMKSDGTIFFERVYPGRYVVAPLANSVSTTYISEVQFGGRDVLGQAIDLAPNPPPMQIVYKSGAGRVRAQFEKDASGIFVLIPADPQGGYPRSVRCSSNGPCEFSGLRPGEYFVAAFDRVEGVKLSDPTSVSTLVALATRIRVEENGNQLITLPVNHWPD
jgi:hypothetical protein